MAEQGRAADAAGSWYRANGKQLYVVLHGRKGGGSEVVQQADIALGNGADGVFLIIHGSHNPQDLLLIYEQVRRAHPSAWIGLNFLCCDAARAMAAVPDGAQALWTDDGVDGKAEGDGFDRAIVEAVAQKRRRGWAGLLFGAFAFKYRKEMPPELYAVRGARAAEVIDVPTTSGPGTAAAMTEEKAAAVRRAVGAGAALAAASGISAANIGVFRPHFDCFVVGSSLETGKYSGVLIPAKVRELADLVHGRAAEDRPSVLARARAFGPVAGGGGAVQKGGAARGTAAGESRADGDCVAELTRLFVLHKAGALDPAQFAAAKAAALRA